MASMEGMVVAQAHQLFADGLTGLAADLCDPRLSAMAVSLTAPLRVAVRGRRGVGRRSVAAALAGAGVNVVAPAEPSGDADVDVYVVAEVVKPEDRTALDTSRRPVLAVLNKVDVSGVDVRVTAALGVPWVPMSALFALAGDDLRPLSGVDDVVARLTALGAAVHYRRMTDAVARLHACAVGDDRIHEFLIADATVAARMAAAEAVMAAHCLAGEPSLRRARRWHGCRSMPLDATGRACAGDIARGSLRLWAATADRS